MPDLEIKINGQKLKFFDNFSFSRSIDSIASTCSFSTFLDLQNYEFSEVEVKRNKALIFTGVVIGKDEPDNVQPEPFIYRCYSKTGILEDCSLPKSAYPIQTINKSLKEVVKSICNNFGIKVKIDSSASSNASKTYKLQDQEPDKKAKDIINSLCTQADLVLSHNAKGELIITKKVLGNQAKDSPYVGSNKTYNYRNFYNKYLVIGQQSITSDTERIAQETFNNIPTERSITKIQRDGDSGSTSNQALAMKNDSYKGNQQTIQRNNYFANVGDFEKFKGVKMIVNSMNYNLMAGKETCSINLLNTKIYER